MEQIFCDALQDMPVMLSAADLVKIGLFSSEKSCHTARKFARRNGYFFPFVRVGRRIFFPKPLVIDFLQNNFFSEPEKKADERRSNNKQ